MAIYETHAERMKARATGNPFHRPRHVEDAYARTLQSIFRDWVKFPRIATLDELFAKMNTLGNLQPAYDIDRIARRMVTMVARGNALSWRAAAAQASQGRRIFDHLKAELAGPAAAKIAALEQANAAMIRTIPHDIAATITKQIGTRQLRGERASTIAKDIQARMPMVASYVIDRIARTEVAKASEAITRVRSQALNLNWYQWLTAEDVRVRLSHRKMDLVLCNFNDPPSPEAIIGQKNIGNYNAGNIYNCRCATAVIVDLDQVSWPARVYRNGSIVRMSRAVFARIAGGAIER